MDTIPLDFNKLIELYNSLYVSSTENSSTVDIVNSLIYNNKLLDEESIKKLSKIKSLSYDNEELKKLIISQHIKNYLIQELFKLYLQSLKKEITYQSSSKIIKDIDKIFDRQSKFYNKQTDFYDKIDQVISSFDELKSKYKL